MFPFFQHKNLVFRLFFHSSLKRADVENPVQRKELSGSGFGWEETVFTLGPSYVCGSGVREGGCQGASISSSGPFHMGMTAGVDVMEKPCHPVEAGTQRTAVPFLSSAPQFLS